MREKVFIFSCIIVIHILSLYAYASEDWRTEFDNICVKTEESMTLKLEELKDLVSRCEKLKPVIEASDNPQKKVFLLRLEKCKKLFIYVINSKEKEGK